MGPLGMRYNFFMEDDIIVAIGTPLQTARRAVLRFSGSGCQQRVLSVLDLLGMSKKVCRALFKEPFQGLPAWVYLFSHGASYTTQEMIELHIPGNLLLVLQIQDHFKSLGCRQADRGEFTRRALEGGRLNLKQAQAVMQVIQAQSQQEHQQALQVLCEDQQSRLQLFQDKLQQALVAIENELDFDEDDQGLLPENYYADLIEELAQDWELLKGQSSQDRLPRVTLWGQANAGKSTLFNYLGGQALVSETSGTTRDYLEVITEINGLSFLLTDTPGYDGPDNLVDRQAKKLAEQICDQSTFVVTLGRLKQKEADVDWHTCADEVEEPWPSNSFSVHEEKGLDDFRHWLWGKLINQSPVEFLNKKNVLEVENIFRDMKSVLQTSASDDGVVFSTHLRELARLVNPLGTCLHPDDVLNDLFSRFCVGK